MIILQLSDLYDIYIKQCDCKIEFIYNVDPWFLKPEYSGSMLAIRVCLCCWEMFE